MENVLLQANYNADKLMLLDKKNRVINGFNIDTVTKAPFQLMQYALLNTDQKSAFDVVSDHQGLSKFSFSISEVRVDDSQAETPCGKGTQRFCMTPARFVLEERIVYWQPPRMYGYSILNCEFILPKHLGIVQVEPITTDTSLLIWRTYFEGRITGGLFARTMLSTVLPDLVSNIAKHFNGRVLQYVDAVQLLTEG